MNKTVVIIGSVVLLGVGAYIYFKPKAKDTTDTGVTGSDTRGTNTTGTNTTSGGSTTVPVKSIVLSTSEEVQALALKITEAKRIATQIKDLKAEKQKFSQLATGVFPALNFKAKLEEIDRNIETLNYTLKGMGYTELDGNIVKIV